MEKYRQEMMKLYGKSTSKNDTVPVQEKIQETVPSDNENITETEIPQIQEISPSEISDINERYPEPVLDEINENSSDTKLNDGEYNKRSNYDSIGWISVNVRTAENASPVENASVVITSMNNGNLIFEATGVTDESGQIKKIALPAPSASLSLDSENLIKPYSVYDISVYADGFFRERSVDVPVFAGITSVQQFNMVPLPLYMTENDETITYYNQEPKLQ